MRTLGIFAKQPVPGRVKTRLAADWGDEQAATLYECFVRDILTRFSKSGDRRVIGFAPNESEARHWFAAVTREQTSAPWELWPQPESDLGGRMTEFFERWTPSAEDRTILIGSDSPTLPDSYLNLAWDALQKRDCVIGPATDGGYYLIGFRSHVRFRTVFQGIDWSTSSVLDQTVSILKHNEIRTELLPVWYDVDSASGVDILRGHLKAIRLANPADFLPHTEEFLGLR